MKKNLKKLSALALALILTSSLSASAFAADISANDAKSIALSHAGYKETEVVHIKAELDYEGASKVYDVDFLVKNADGSYLDYDYEISADGKIRKYDVEREGKANGSSSNKVIAPTAKNNADIGAEAAKNAALAHFGVKSEDVKFISVKKDYDDGIYVYEIEFCKPYDVKYSCDVIAASGAVKDVEKDVSRNIFDKIELFFEVLFFQLFNR